MQKEIIKTIIVAISLLLVACKPSYKRINPYIEKKAVLGKDYTIERYKAADFRGIKVTGSSLTFQVFIENILQDSIFYEINGVYESYEKVKNRTFFVSPDYKYDVSVWMYRHKILKIFNIVPKPGDSLVIKCYPKEFMDGRYLESEYMKNRDIY